MSKKKDPKNFVLDTNVILHDSACIHQFGNNNVIIPITVLEELDKFKKGNESLNYHAREFVRTIDNLSKEAIFKTGVPLGPDMGRIFIDVDSRYHDDLSFHFPSTNPDHRILNCAYCISKDHPDETTLLISKDVNLRMKAKSVGLLAQDYVTDHVKNVTTMYRGRHVEMDVPDEVINAMYNEPFEIDYVPEHFSQPVLPNEYLILKNERKSALAVYDVHQGKIRHIDKRGVYGIHPRNSEQTFALDALLNNNIPLVSLSGKAGTGKTLLALAGALERHDHYKQIYLARPIVPLSNRDIGYLPGDVQSKLDPYMQPLYDNLGVIQNQYHPNDTRYGRIKELRESEFLKIAPLSYIRGRSLVQIYFIVDEAQNLTPHEVKTIITRAGEGTKVVFTGDIFQIDHPYLDTESNGLSYLIEKMQGQKLYAHVNLEKGERSELAELASNIL